MEMLAANPETASLNRHKGRSLREGLKLAIPLALFGLICGGTLFLLSRSPVGRIGSGALIGLALACSLWVLRFFRDFQPCPLLSPEAVAAPAHGVVDVIEETEEPHVFGGRCKRLSIYLSLSDVHVQNAPISGRIVFCRLFPGRLSRAIDPNAGLRNEHLLFGFADEQNRERKVAVRLIAGIWVRRIVPWAMEGDLVARSERISLIRFGSRADVFLPLEATVKVKLGDRVIGGETALAEL